MTQFYADTRILIEIKYENLKTKGQVVCRSHWLVAPYSSTTEEPNIYGLNWERDYHLLLAD